jgi:hypothetical protein
LQSKLTPSALNLATFFGGTAAAAIVAIGMP